LRKEFQQEFQAKEDTCFVGSFLDKDAPFLAITESGLKMAVSCMLPAIDAAKIKLAGKSPRFRSFLVEPKRFWNGPVR
jgi:hypothetical protein